MFSRRLLTHIHSSMFARAFFPKMHSAHLRAFQCLTSAELPASVISHEVVASMRHLIFGAEAPFVRVRFTSTFRYFFNFSNFFFSLLSFN